MKEADWNFSQCPADELRQCWAYEYAKHCPPIIEMVEKYRKGKNQSTFTKLRGVYPYDKASNVILGKPIPPFDLYIFPFSPEWPNSNYLKIEEKSRKERIKWVGEISTYPSVCEIPGKKWVWSFEKGKNEVVLDIDWTAPMKQLIRDFEVFVNERKPKGIISRELRGHCSPVTKIKTQLKELGAWRLLEKVDWMEASRLTADAKDKSLYNTQSSWAAAVSKAKNTISEINKTKSLWI